MATKSVGFGVDATQLSAPQGAGAQAIQGVATPTSTFTLPEGIMNIGVQVVKDIRAGEIAKTKEAKDAQKNDLISRYVTSVNRLVEDGEASGMSPSEITARRRAIGSQFASQAASMGIIEDLDKANKALNNLGAAGAVESAEEQARAQRIKDVDFLRGRGRYVPPTASPEYIQELLDNSAQLDFYEKQYQQERKEIDSSRSDLTFSQSQADRATKEAGVKYLTSYAATQFTATQTQTQEVADRFRSGEITIDEARLQINKSAVETEAVLVQMAASNPELATPYKQAFSKLHEVQLKRLESPSEELDLELKTHINRAKLMMIQRTPEALQAVAASQLLGQTTIGALNAESLAARIIPQMTMTDTSKGNVVTNVVGSTADKNAENTLYSVASQGLDLVRSGKALNQEASKKESFQLVNNILDQLGDKYGSGKIASKDLLEVTTFMQSDSFAYFVKEGGLNPAIATQAKKAYQQLYAKDVNGTIRAALAQEVPMGTRETAIGKTAVARGEAPETTPMTTMDLIDLNFVGGAVQFVPKPDSEVGKMTSSKNAITQERIRELRSHQNLLNKVVRIGAHLEGTTDYQAYWEKNKSAILPHYYSNDQYPIGVVVDGYKLKAYPYNNPKNWEKVSGSE